MATLDYRRRDHEPSNRGTGIRTFLLILPTLLMATGGLMCILPAVMPFDLSSIPVDDPVTIAWRWMLGLTSPVGITTLGFSYWFSQRRGRAWLWLNWCIFGLYEGIIVVLMYVGPR